jgi:hypothetical protein
MVDFIVPIPHVLTDIVEVGACGDCAKPLGKRRYGVGCRLCATSSRCESCQVIHYPTHFVTRRRL